MTLCRPELELGVAPGSNLQQRIVPPIMEFNARDGLGVAAIEILRQAQDGGETLHDFAPLSSKLCEVRLSA